LSQLGALQPLQFPHRRILFFLEIPLELIPLDTASWSMEKVPTPKGDSDLKRFVGEGDGLVNEISSVLQLCLGSVVAAIALADFTVLFALSHRFMTESMMHRGS